MFKIVVFLGVVSSVYSATIPNCMNPWQVEMKSGTNYVTCSATNKTPCLKGRNGVCTFTFLLNKYICCEDLANATTPICPKYFDSLSLVCNAQSSNACPTGYNCMMAINYNGTICCRSNPNQVYPEPASSFTYNLITPKFIPKAPTTLLQVNNFKLGQEVQASGLTAEPNITYMAKDNTTYHTIIAFDISVAQPANPQWMKVNARANATNKFQLDLSTGTTDKVKWTAPAATAQPYGQHVIVFALYEQKAEITTDNLPASDTAAPWDVAGNFTAKYSSLIGNILAGTYVTLTTAAAS